VHAVINQFALGRMVLVEDALARLDLH